MRVLDRNEANLVSGGVNPDLIIGGLGPAPSAGENELPASTAIGGNIVGFFKGIWSDL